MAVKMKNCNIMIVGVGGQGTLLASRVIGNAALASGYDVKVSEVHGMSQRGGSVVTYVRFGEKVDSPLIDKGEADIIMSFERLEALRWLPYLKKGGKLIVNEQVIDPMPVITGAQKYPQDILPSLKKTLGDKNAAVLDAESIAEGCGTIKAVNTVMLGVLAGTDLTGISRENWEKSLSAVVPPKFLTINLAAFAKGYERGAANEVL